MTAREQLLSEIEAFLTKTGMYATTFGRRICNDTALVSRIRAGSNVRIDTAERIRDFMRAHTPKKSRRTSGNAPAVAA